MPFAAEAPVVQLTPQARVLAGIIATKITAMMAARMRAWGVS